jgi:putative ABC transport system permease protein
MELAPSRLSARDTLRAGSIGLRTRRLRASLSILGIAIGIAALVAVLGISDSSKADLIATIDRLGTNLLTVGEGQSLTGTEVTIPQEAEAMVGRMDPVIAVSAIADVPASVRRTGYIPDTDTGGITVKAARTNLLSMLIGSMRTGVFLNDATSEYPVLVLGAVAAERLGLERLAGGRVWVDDQWFVVAGVMRPLRLAPDIDRSALIGFGVADRLYDADETPTKLYVRSDPDRVDAVRGVLASTMSPDAPEEMDVGRPSDALEARAAAKSAFTSLFLGPGLVTLVVGGVGIANVMVISVLERRSEIGLRRALGATRRHISVQFLSESLLLSGLGGALGAALGAAITIGYAWYQGWSIVMSPWTLAGGVVAALVIGALAGLYPATRAARMSPTEALRTV